MGHELGEGSTFSSTKFVHGMLTSIGQPGIPRSQLGSQWRRRIRCYSVEREGTSSGADPALQRTYRASA